METFRALIRGDLAPAGYPISTKKSAAPDYLFSRDYRTYWLDSGTSSLALALLDCKARHPDITKPQVIIPGYCCPDLVAAAVYAGVQPLVVDIQENDPAYDLDQLRAALNPNVIAVIAINFLGLRECLQKIRQLISECSPTVYLIEDNAQWFPDIDCCQFESDYVVFSFGRGKPLALLGGGALLTKQPLNQPVNLEVGETFGFKTRAKISAYNSLLHPHLYCFLNRAPFLHLGETRYHPLIGITQAPDSVRFLFADNYRAYQQRSSHAEICYQSAFLSQISQASQIQQLKALVGDRKGRLLRYPLLFKTAESCTDVYQKLCSAGLGASRLYQQSLDKIEGVEDKIQCFSNLPNAAKFASRLITLPTHGFVKRKHIEKIINIVLFEI